MTQSIYSLDQVHLHRIDSFEDNPYPRSWYAQRLGTPRYVGKVIGYPMKGFIFCKSFPDYAYVIASIIVDAEYRRQGLGSQLMRSMQEASNALGMLVGEDCLELQLFLKKMGFTGEYVRNRQRKKGFGNHRFGDGLLFRWFSKTAVPSTCEPDY